MNRDSVSGSSAGAPRPIQKPIQIGKLQLDIPYEFYGLTPPPAPGYRPEVEIRPRVVSGCTVRRLIVEGDPALEEPTVEAARQLAKDGARVIISNCGFMIRHQAAVSDAVDVPVLLSSLLLAPTLLASLGTRQKLGIITASKASLTDDVLSLAGIRDPERVVIGGLEGRPAFRAGMLDCTVEPDEHAIEKETLEVIAALIEEHRDIESVLLECTALPPFAAAVQDAIGMPVFDLVNLVDLVVDGLVPSGGYRHY